jgi:hypothetical protein
MAQQQSVTLPWTQASVTALANAIASGAMTVDYQDRRVTYRSVADMSQLLDRMVRYLNNQGDGVPVPNTRGSVYISR